MTVTQSAVDPFLVLNRRRETTPVMEGDVFTTEYGIPTRCGGPTGDRRIFSVFGYQDISHVLQNPTVFSSKIRDEGRSTIVGKTLSGMDGDQHRIWRGMLQPVFGRRALQYWKDEVAKLVIDEKLDLLAKKRSAELMDDLAIDYPISVIYRLLGLSSNESEQRHFAELAATILDARPDRRLPGVDATQAALDAAGELHALLLPIVAERRADRSDSPDLLSQLLRAEFEGRTLNDDEIVSFVRSLLPAAAHTTTRGMSNLLVRLTQQPAQLEQLREDPGLIGTAINESLRYDPPGMQLQRITTVETEIAGMTIPADAGIVLVIGAGNRDPHTYEEPDSFRMERTGRMSLSFGSGPHLCIGMHIAKIEIEVGINALLARFPNLRADPGVTPAEIVGITERFTQTLPVLLV